MKSIHLLFIFFLGMHLQYVHAQTVTNAAKSNKDEIIKKIEEGDRNAVLELGSTGDQTIIPYLQKLLENPNKVFGGVAANAQMALAKLGQKKQMDEILVELESNDPSLQDNAIKKLIYVANNEAIKALAKLLDDNKWRKGPDWVGPKGERAMDKVFYSPRSELAMKALSQIVQNPPTSPPIEPTEEHLQEWREWWAKNKDRYK